MRAGSIPATIDDKTMFYIAVSADMPTAELVEAVPARFKVGAPDDVDKLVLSAMPACGFVYTPQVPPASSRATSARATSRSSARRTARTRSAAGALGNDLCAVGHQRSST